MTQTKVCTECGYEGTLRWFKRWDLLCKACRVEAGPQNFRGGQIKGPERWHKAPRKPTPKPSGRRVRARRAPARVSV